MRFLVLLLLTLTWSTPAFAQVVFSRSGSFSMLRWNNNNDAAAFSQKVIYVGPTYEFAQRRTAIETSCLLCPQGYRTTYSYFGQSIAVTDVRIEKLLLQLYGRYKHPSWHWSWRRAPKGYPPPNTYAYRHEQMQWAKRNPTQNPWVIVSGSRNCQ